MGKPPLPPNEQRRLKALEQYRILDTLPEKAFDDITSLAAYICGTPMALIAFVDSDRQWFKARVGLDFSETSRDVSFCAHAILEPDDILVIPDAPVDERFAGNPLVAGAPHIRFYAGAPLVTAGGQALGTLCVLDQRPRVLTTEQLTALRTLSGCIVAELELRRANSAAKESPPVPGNDLRQHEYEFADALLDSLPGVFYLYDENRHFLRWNKNFTDVTGYSDAEMGDRHPLDFFPETDKALLAERIQEVFVEGEASVEADFVAKDGTRMPYFFTGKRVMLGDKVCLMGVGIDIGGRKAAELALQKQERFLTAVVETSPAIIYVYDMASQSNVYANDGIMRLLGYSPEAVQAMGPGLFASLIHPDDVTAVIAFQDKIAAAADDEILEIAYRMRRADDSWRSMHSYERPFLRNEDGSLKQKIGIAIDVTAMTQIQEALRRSEALYADLYENAPDMYASVAAATGKIIQSNQTFAQMTGFSKEDIIGRHIFNLYHPDSLVKAQKAFQQFVTVGEVRDAELQLQCKDGRRLDVSLSVTAVRDETGKILHSRSVWRDISQRKQAESALRQSEDMFSSAFHIGPAAMTITRIADGKFINANGSFLDLFGFSREEVIGHTSTELNILAPEARNGLILKQIASGGLRNAELLAQTKSGRRIHLLFSSHPMNIAGEECHITTLIDITERKEAEEKLRESEARYRQLLDVSPVGVAVHVDGKIAFTNPAGARLLGAASPDDLIGQPITAIIHPDNLPQAAARIKRMLAGEAGLYPTEDRYVRLDGAVIPVEVMAVPLIYEGKPGVQVMVSDISERKRMERDLEAARKMFQDMFYWSPISGVLAKVPERTVVEVNPAFEALTGYAREDVIGRSALNFDLWADKSARQEALMHLEKHSRLRDYEFIFKMKSGATGHGLFYQESFDQGDQKFTLTNVVDISASKEAELKIKESEKRYRNTLDAAKIGIWDWNLQTDLWMATPTYFTMLGYDPESDGQNRAVWGGRTHPDDFDFVIHEMETVRDEGLPGFDIELRFRHKDGTYRWLNSVGKGIEFDANGKTTRMLGLQIDITERKQAEEALLRLNAELEQRIAQRTAELAVAKERAEAADRLKSAFLATMSHELRTPLNSIIGFTGILLQQLPGQLNPEQAKQLGMVQSSARHLLALINDVLDISKIEAGQLEVALAPFNAYQLVTKVAQASQVLADKKGLALRVVIDSAVGELNSDRRRVEQIVINLVTNAIKFTDQGEVGIHCWVADGRFLIRVTDTGIGIKQKDLNKLFQPFRQIESGLDRKAEGTGLGLSICQKLVELLNGVISVESKWGVGSAFTVSLPL